MRNWLHFLSLLLLCPTLFASDPELTADLVHRRESVLQKMGNRGMLILFSADRRPYSGDIAYEFRQENNLFYLTGIRQPDTTLVLMPQNSSRREILFLSDRNPQREIWDGKMLSPQEASEVSGIQTIWSASEFDSFLDSTLNGHPYQNDNSFQSSEYRDFFADLEKNVANIFLLMEPKARMIEEVRPELPFANRLRERFTGIQIKDASLIFHQLRVIKSPYELKQLREAIDITVQALIQAMQSLHPGIWEYEVEALIEYVFKKRNSFDWAFPSIVASGPNATTLHYQKSQRQTQDGELLLMDIGAEYNYYAADITRTIPVNGKFTPEQAAIYQIVLKAQEAAIASIRPGASLSAVHQRAVDELKEGLLRLGLITDTSSHQYRVFTIHGIGHFVGLDVHDVSYGEHLESNMVLTVEPGIYVREDSEERLAKQGVNEKELEKIRPALRKFMNIGVRIEEDVLVTENGYQVLSEGAPREIHEIEARMGNR
ncbi:MAG: aminopeptidase P family protein [Acidobacteria bacterium]|nr:aminopeptidase P family protein [Acidobacteriota bacterium]